jgi:membrane peptidoglycan carboxypeptidase
MNKSINSVFAQMGVDVGMDQVMKTAGELGMDVEGARSVPAQTLGTMGASPLEMAGVYATLDNHGKKVTPALVKSVKHKDRSVEFPEAIGERVISREAADTVTSVLTGVVDDGTARTSVRDNPARDGQQVAGKTGTSDCNKSAWFTGYTPKLVTSVGVFGEAAEAGTTRCGKDKPVKVKAFSQVTLQGAAGGGRVNGGGYPAQIWATYTFGAMGGVSKFDLDTNQGAAVQPTITPTVTNTPTTPAEEPTPEDPTTKPATTSPPAESSPEDTPSDEDPPSPTVSVTTSPPGGIELPPDPDDPQDGP